MNITGLSIVCLISLTIETTIGSDFSKDSDKFYIEIRRKLTLRKQWYKKTFIELVTDITQFNTIVVSYSTQTFSDSMQIPIQER